MLYWLFTEGRALLGGCMVPLLCLTVLAPLVVAGLLGAGIRRADSVESLKGRRLFVLGTYLVTNLGAAALYLTLFGDTAIARPSGRRVTGGLVLLLTGAPPTVDSMRLFMSGMGLALTVLTVSLGLHSALRPGGWLREWADRLRRPAVRRGEMGSAHFCTFREYRRYRRLDRDGVALLGAFWGERRRRLDFGFGRFCLTGEVFGPRI